MENVVTIELQAGWLQDEALSEAPSGRSPPMLVAPLRFWGFTLVATLLFSVLIFPTCP